MSQIECNLPNKHYVPVDFSKFSKITGAENDEVFLPYDCPAGNIHAILGRKSLLPHLFEDKSKL
jgi:hypothetical protein